jgi:hypothetical protein
MSADTAWKGIFMCKTEDIEKDGRNLEFLQ